MKIIDAHSHYLPEEIVKAASFYNSGWTDIEGQLKLMDASNIEKAILSYPTTDAHIKLGGEDKACKIYNDALSKVIKKFPNRFIGLCIVPIWDPKKMTYEFLRAHKELSLRGVSLASNYGRVYLDDKRFFPLYEEAQKEDVPVFVHIQTIDPIGLERVDDPLITPVLEYVFDMSICISKMMMAGVFNDFKDLKFVFAHFGGVLPFLKDRFDTVYTMLRLRNIVKDLGKAPSEILKNIYCDTSAVKSKNILQLALDMFGPEHLLWGSDYPANKDIAGALSPVNELDISSEQKEMIFGSNMLKLINGGITICK